MTTWLANRNSNLSSFNAVAINYSTLTGSTLTNTSAINVSSVNVSSINTLTINTLTINTSLVNTSTLNTRLLLTSTIQVNSSMISLGSSTNQVYTNMSQGNFSSSTKWISSLYNLTSTNNVSMSANSQYQLALSPSTNTTALQITSTFGQSWTTLTGATGLPIATSYTAEAISGNGQYAALGAYGGYMYTTANSGQTWTNTNPNTGSLYAQLSFEGNTNDISGNGRITSTLGSVTYVPGIVGTRAVNIINTNGGSATQSVTIQWPGATNFTFSGWFNVQSLWSSGYAENIFSAYNGGFILSVGTSNNPILNWWIPSGGSTVQVLSNPPIIALNTWYNYTAIFQTGGVCSLYLNNILIGTYTNTSGTTGSPNSGNIVLGRYDSILENAFNNVYFDDFKVYNAAIIPTPMVPQNWSNVAISNSGQYMLAAATGAGLYLSSNYGSTWSQVTGAMLSAIWSAAQVSATGQYMLAYSTPQMVQPQLTGLASSGTALTTSSWQTSGITWIASASSVLAANPLSSLFDNVTTASWANSLQVYTNGGNSASFTTNIIGVTQTPYSTGDWVQIQSSVPLVMYSYQLANGLAISQTPNIFYIAGSTDGITWYPIQRAEITGGGTTGTGSSYTLIPGVIRVNSTAAQTFGSITLTGTTYATTTNAYTYFRFICTSIFSSSSTYVAFSEWIINFQAGGQTYSTNYGSTWNNGYTIPSNVLSLAPSGQYALAAYCPQLIAELNFENVYTDSALGLTYVSTAGAALSFSSSTYKVGSYSLFCNNDAGGTTAVGGGSLSYANYTVPSFLALPSILTVSFWINPTSTIGQSCPLAFNNGGAGPGPYFYLAPTMTFAYYTSTAQSGTLAGTTTISTGLWTHVALTFLNGVLSLYVNGVMQNYTVITGTLALNTALPITNMFIGCIYTTGGGYNGYVDDLRIYSTALSLSQVNTLYNNGAYVVQASTILAPMIYPVSTLQGFSAALPTASTFTLGSTALNASTNFPIASACSSSGQYMVFVTNNASTNNVYYSSNYGSTFTGFQIGSALTSCAISYDGSYITISNATNVWTLNNNSNGFSLAIGNQAGYQNQAVNAIAIGNYAGTINQTANSIILNASGSALNAVANGFYVAPIVSYTASSFQTFSLLGYGSDNQIVQTGLTFSSSSSIINNSTTDLIISTSMQNTWITLYPAYNNGSGYPSVSYGAGALSVGYTLANNGEIDFVNNYGMTGNTQFGITGGFNFYNRTGASTSNLLVSIKSTGLILNGNVGIGTTNPATRLHVYSSGTVTGAILVENAAADDVLSKSFLSGRNYAALMPSFSGTSVYLYGTIGTTPYRYMTSASTYFTGQHANQPIDSDLKNNIQNYVGFIVSSADQGYYSINPVTHEIITDANAITITESLPYINLTTVDQDPAVWGVLTNVKNDNVNTDGTITTDENNVWGDRLSTMVRVNGLGEGAVWVTNINGPIVNGDWICSSIIPGYGKKQNDDLFHNYTVAKATMSCIFDLNNNNKYKCKIIEYNGTTYIAAFIGCSYHCS